MPNVEGWYRAGCKRLALAVFMVFAFCGNPSYAFTPASSPLLSSAAVTPNVMLLVDDSGSMNSIIWATGFDSTATRQIVYTCTTTYSFFSSNACGAGTALTASDTNIQLSELPTGGCSSGYYGFASSLVNPNRVCLKLPDPVGSKTTRYSTAYLAYLLTLAGYADKDFTGGTIIPSDYRINVARTVATSLVAANRSLRMGLATFYAATNSVAARGGYIARTIADLQATTQTTAAVATDNFNKLNTAIAGLAAVANTPLAETYYEITRYFRGLVPYWGSGTTAYTSPIQYRCQKNYGVVITDGLPTYDRTFPPTDNSQTNSVGTDPDVTATQALPNWDNKANDGNNPTGGDNEGDSLYLDDIAKFAYDIDMRKGTNSAVDLASKSWDATDFPKQNMQTYTVGFTSSNQMLADAATYGQGKYFQANDAASLTSALITALNAINSQAGSGGAGSTSSSTLKSDTFYYQTLYDPTDWRGVIRAYPLGTDGSVSSTLSWTTDTTMAATATNSATFESWNTSTNKTIALALGNFSSAQQTTLATNLPTGATATGLVNWVKGVNSTGLKARTVLLGDIINSTLGYASPSVQTATDLVGDSTYSTYLTTKAAGMTPTLVVNANDGLTDVINANTGTRIYGYMPSTALSSLYQVADPTYINGTSHKFLDDGQIGIYDANVNSGWKTLAVGGTGSGGRSYYALQLYDGASNTPKALWEISAPTTASTSNVYNDLGYAYSKPEVAKLPDGTWAAFIGNGYGSNSGVAALYVVSLTDGSLIKKIVIDSTETTNGLGSVKLVVNSSNVVQAAYGGDLKGRMWKFDLSSTSTSSWGLAFSGKPLFTASGGTTQPITAQPLLVTNSTSGYMVYFGTGKFNEITDKTTTDLQSFYAVWDASTSTGNYTIANLQPQSITGTFTGTSGQYMTTSSNTVDYTTLKGWYLPLSYNGTMIGERVIYQAAYTLGRILFTTAGVDSTDPCASQGFGRLVEIDALSGAMLSYAVLDTNGDGLVDTNDTRSSGMIFSSGIPSLNSIVDVASTSSTSGTQRKIVNDSSANITVLTEAGNPSSGSGRIMWRQIQ